MDNGDQRFWEEIRKKIQIIKKESKQNGTGELQKYLGGILKMVTQRNKLGLVKKLIEEENLDPNDEDINGNNSLMIAADNGHVNVLEYFLSLSDKININAQNKYGDTSLHIACYNGLEEVVRILMGSPQLDVNIAENDGNTALFLACFMGHDPVTSMLLGHEDIQVNKANVDLETPLMAACSAEHTGVVRLLLARDDVDVNAQNKNKVTALMYSCITGAIENVRCLLDHADIDVNLENSNHETAPIFACDYDKTEIISKLLQREDLQRTTRNLEVMKYFVMLRRVENMDMRAIIETAVSKNLPEIAVWLLKFEGSRNFGRSFYLSLLAKATRRHVSLVEFIKDQKLAEACSSDGCTIRGAAALEAAFPSVASSVTTETPFEIEEGEPQDKAGAGPEWDNKMKDLDNLREEKEELQVKIRVKENEFEGLKFKVTEMIDNQAKEMTNYVSDISKTRDEKAQNDKEIKKLKAQIVKVEERQRECTARIENMEQKKKELEKCMDTEMTKMEAAEVAIAEDIERLNKALCSNIKATEDLARFKFSWSVYIFESMYFFRKDVVRAETTAVGGGTNRMMDFLSKSIKEKEADLRCPVCFETAEVPIYTCQEMHLICSNCRPKLRECPECRAPYQAQPRRHRSGH